MTSCQSEQVCVLCCFVVGVLQPSSIPDGDVLTSSPGVRVLVDAREKLHIPWGDPSNQQHGDRLMAFDTRSAMMASGQLETSIFLRYLPAIKDLWADSGIQNAYDRRREFQLVRGHTHTHTEE